MKKILVLIVGATALVNVPVARSVPVVPNFTQGSMTSHTETTSTVVETINSMDYSTGFTYSISGHGVTVNDPEGLTPPDTSTSTNTVNGVNSTWTGLDLSTANKPNWKQSEAGAAFQFTEHYSGPGLQTHTIIQRETTVQSVTESTSIFSN